MTTQREILALGKKHESQAAVRVLLGSIAESQVAVKQALGTVRAMTETLERASMAEEGFSLSPDHSDLVAQAAKASAGMAKIYQDMFNLACVLQALGEDISY